MNAISLESLLTSTKCARDIYEHESKEDFVKCRIITSAISTGIGLVVVTIIMILYVLAISFSNPQPENPTQTKLAGIAIWLVTIAVISGSFGYNYLSAGKTYDIFADDIRRKMEIGAMTRPQAIAAYKQELIVARDLQLKQQQINATNAQTAAQTTALFSIASALAKK